MVWIGLSRTLCCPVIRGSLCGVIWSAEGRCYSLQWKTIDRGRLRHQGSMLCCSASSQKEPMEKNNISFFSMIRSLASNLLSLWKHIVFVGPCVSQSMIHMVWFLTRRQTELQIFSHPSCGNWLPHCARYHTMYARSSFFPVWLSGSMWYSSRTRPTTRSQTSTLCGCFNNFILSDLILFWSSLGRKGCPEFWRQTSWVSKQSLIEG